MIGGFKFHPRQYKMVKLNDKPIRVDPLFAQTMKDLAEIRVHKGLAKMKKEDMSSREMTRLLTKTLGFRQSVEEMKVKPKKERII